MENKPTKRRFNIPLTSLIGIALIVYFVSRLIPGLSTTVKEIPYSEFKTDLAGGKVSSVLVSAISISGKLRDGTAFTTVRVEDLELTQTMEAQKVEIQGQLESNGGVLGFLLTWILPMGLMVGLWYWLMGRSRSGAGSMGSVFSFGKSKARVIQGEQTGVTFKDVGRRGRGGG